jgi:YARHG domain
MAGESNPQNFWQTLPGILTAAGAFLGALTAFLVAVHGWFVPPQPEKRLATPQPVAVETVRPTSPPTQDFGTPERRLSANEPAKGTEDFSTPIPVPPQRRTPGPWLFPDSSSRFLNWNELAILNRDQLWRARNEIFARRGLIFSTDRGRAFAMSLGSSYRGLDADQNRVFAEMNEFEKKNIRLIQEVESSLK